MGMRIDTGVAERGSIVWALRVGREVRKRETPGAAAAGVRSHFSTCLTWLQAAANSPRAVDCLPQGITRPSRRVNPSGRTTPRGAVRPPAGSAYIPRIWAKMSGATMEASDSMMYFGVSMPSFPQVIFSLGTAPE